MRMVEDLLILRFRILDLGTAGSSIRLINLLDSVINSQRFQTCVL